MDLPSLYPIVNLQSADSREIARCRGLAEQLAECGCSLIQLRAKPVGTGVFAALATELVGALKQHDARLIVNDRVDVALAAGAAGVHLGDTDLHSHCITHRMTRKTEDFICKLKKKFDVF